MKIENESEIDQPETMLEELALEGLKNRMTAILAKYPERDTEQQVYQDRLVRELDIIKQAQLSGYFLMLSDIVGWAKDHDIPVGPGRGAIVGSLVAFTIRITDIDPLLYNLLFERCLNSERRIMPEVDIDVCIDRRDEVFQYVVKKYGGDLDNDGCRLRIQLPVKLDHAVSPVAQSEMEHLEATCTVKLNFQGLNHLTANYKAVQLIRAGNSPDFDLANIRDDDPDTLRLIASGKTKNTFQFESGGMKDFIRQFKPNCFEDLIAVISLFRPVPIESGMAHDVIERKHGHRKIVYELPQLEPILKDTYGVTIYQEQFLEIFRAIGGYTLGEADLLRRGLIKMGAAELSINKKRFLAGAKKQGICAETAKTIFDRMALYGEHYFLKAHATAYAMVSYQSAYLKAHYPEEFKTAFGHSR
jgi:DNA polymerase III alpha subunit